MGEGEGHISRLGFPSARVDGHRGRGRKFQKHQVQSPYNQPFPSLPLVDDVPVTRSVYFTLLVIIVPVGFVTQGPSPPFPPFASLPPGQKILSSTHKIDLMRG